MRLFLSAILAVVCLSTAAGAYDILTFALARSEKRIPEGDTIGFVKAAVVLKLV
jgi:hypothetical protein